MSKYGGEFIYNRENVWITKHRKHVLARQYSTTQYWKQYFKFSFVRNPWDKECSDYHYHNKGRLSRGEGAYKNLKEYLQIPQAQPNHDNFYWHSNQLRWLHSSNKKIEIDFIGRFESLQEDFNVACDKIGIPKQQLPHLNATKHKHYTEYYNDETIEMVAEKYAKDIEYFGYKFGEQ